ncbi:MAG: Stp1/IreP family PP2C-type Ser/Thr phosphatase [Oscillospiraceae bacterium]|nr:Stp1/IreP family PP2C-type Ser/Thr phosphatase [Oscillospiraceae bacterium]
MIAWGLTDKGVVRAQNQDAFFLRVFPEDGMAIAAVCDGMGGARAGDVASNMALGFFSEEILRALRPNLTVQEIAGILTYAAHRANAEVFLKSESGGAFSGMGTTLVAAVISGNRAVVANAGDSRAYFITPNGIVCVTRDHSLVEDLMCKGDITPEEAKSHPSKNLITRALGTDPHVDCDLFELEMAPGDALLLCSDGLTNVVDDQEILHEVQGGVEPEQACRQLLRLACDRGGPDNITVVIVSL